MRKQISKILFLLLLTLSLANCGGGSSSESPHIDPNESQNYALIAGYYSGYDYDSGLTCGDGYCSKSSSSVSDSLLLSQNKYFYRCIRGASASSFYTPDSSDGDSGSSATCFFGTYELSEDSDDPLRLLIKFNYERWMNPDKIYPECENDLAKISEFSEEAYITFEENDGSDADENPIDVIISGLSHPFSGTKTTKTVLDNDPIDFTKGSYYYDFLLIGISYDVETKTMESQGYCNDAKELADTCDEGWIDRMTFRDFSEVFEIQDGYSNIAYIQGFANHAYYFCGKAGQTITYTVESAEGGSLNFSATFWRWKVFGGAGGVGHPGLDTYDKQTRDLYDDGRYFLEINAPEGEEGAYSVKIEITEE